MQATLENVHMKQQVDMTVGAVNAMRMPALHSCWPLVGTYDPVLRLLADDLDVKCLKSGAPLPLWLIQQLTSQFRAGPRSGRMYRLESA